jgi:hypothetical protein
LLFQVMTAKRWELLRAMTGAGPLAIREAARRVELTSFVLGAKSVLIEAVPQRLDAMRQRRETVEHPFGTMQAPTDMLRNGAIVPSRCHIYHADYSLERMASCRTF